MVHESIYKNNNAFKSYNIVDVISSFLHLKKSGSGFFALCPFHSEKTPSFYVNQKQQKYYCFGCNKHGNVIDFISNYKKSGINDAVKVPFKNNINKNFIDSYVHNTTKIDNVLNVFNEIVIKSFNSKNKINSFLEQRSLSCDIVVLFKIGFVPNNFNFFLKKNSYHNDIKLLTDIGFFKQYENKIYTRFKNRIIFPIKNLRGEIIGLGGRTIYDGFKPKYINSPESKIFSKKKEFYGLYESLSYGNKNDDIIIVEGYLDVITLHKYGINNTAAILGTSLSQEHITTLKSLYKKVIFCFDGDNAGKLAALRSAYLCLSSLLDFESIKFIVMPKNFDPDSFLRQYGNIKFKKLINNAIFIIDFILISLNLINNIDKSNIKFFFKINKLLSKIDNILIKAFFINYISCIEKQKHSVKIKFETLSLGIKAIFFLLKNKSLFLSLNLEKIVMNKNIHFKSDFNIFFELLFLLKYDLSLNFLEINKRLIKRIKLKNLDFIRLINKMPSNILKNEFLNVIYKILN